MGTTRTTGTTTTTGKTTTRRMTTRPTWPTSSRRRTRNQGPTSTTSRGVGGVFMMLLEGIVVGVGALMCAIGSWFAHKFYKGEKLPFELLAPPSAAEEAAMLSGGKANVPITPDVAYTGKG